MPPDIFEEARLKREQLLAIFETLPITTIHGVVGATGPGGSKAGQETHWSLNLHLIAWRTPGAPIRKTELTVTKTVSDEELKTLQDAMDSESIIAFQGRLCENSPFGDARAQLVSLLDAPLDHELESILSQYRQPVEINDAVVGALVLNKSVNWFEGQIVWLGKQIEIAVSLDANDSPADALHTAKSLLESMREWTDKVNDYAACELLELKNESWLDEDESPISKQDFLNLMRLKSITVYPDGAFEFWHDDGDLFWGHTILVAGSLKDGITDASIAG